MQDLLEAEDYQIPTFHLDDYIEGKIVSINPKEVLVDIGGKAYAVVGHKELEYLDDLFAEFSEGDKVVGRVISEENRDGRVVISLTKFAFDHRWNKLREAYQNGTAIEVLVRDIVDGGILVDYSGVRGYMPTSHIDPDYRDDPQKLRGRGIEVKILELDRDQNRFVISQKLVTREDEIKAMRQAMKKVKVGDIIEAEVEGIVPFGIFVRFDTGVRKDEEPIYLEGLIHISEIAWEKVDDPSDYYQEGDKVEVKILEKDEKEGKLNLSIKQTTEDPWAKIEKKYEQGEMVSGDVVRETAYGVFVELEKGVEGLAHISNIPAGQEPKTGDKVTVQIDSINKDERRIALSVLPTEKPVMYR